MALVEELKKQGDFLFKYRTYFPLILLLAGLGLIVWEGKNGIVGIRTWYHLAFILSMLGLLIRVLTIGYSDKNTSGRNTKAGQVADSLNKSGLYSITRNPLYLGNYFMWLGVALLPQNIWFVCVFSMVFWVYYERIIFAEEQFLRAKFKAQYLIWAHKVPPFVPSILRFNKVNGSFNLKKVIEQEINGYFALIVVFNLFLLVQNYLMYETLYFKIEWLQKLLILSSILFMGVKIISKNTDYFES